MHNLLEMYQNNILPFVNKKVTGGGQSYKNIGFISLDSKSSIENRSKNLVSTKLFCCDFFFVEVTL